MQRAGQCAICAPVWHELHLRRGAPAGWPAGDSTLDFYRAECRAGASPRPAVRPWCRRVARPGAGPPRGDRAELAIRGRPDRRHRRSRIPDAGDCKSVRHFADFRDLEWRLCALADDETNTRLTLRRPVSRNSTDAVVRTVRRSRSTAGRAAGVLVPHDQHHAGDQQHCAEHAATRSSRGWQSRSSRSDPAPATSAAGRR